METLAPSFPLKGENRIFEPVAGTAYHRFTLLPTSSENTAYGSGVEVREKGIFQIDVMYPKDEGVDAAFIRADLIRDHFFTNAKPISLTEGGTTVRVIEKPSMKPMSVPSNQPFVQIPVQVKYFALN